MVSKLTGLLKPKLKLMTLPKKTSILFRQLFVTISFVATCHSGLCQQVPGQIKNPDFETSTIEPWATTGNGAFLSATVPYEGKQSIELRSGTSIWQQIPLKPLSHYKLTAWLKTGSGSGDVRLNIKGLGPHNASIASAMAAWTQVKVDIFTGADQRNATIEIENPENAGKNSAWADGLQLEFIEGYVPQKIVGISPLKVRKPKTEGIGIQGKACYPKNIENLPIPKAVTTTLPLINLTQMIGRH